MHIKIAERLKPYSHNPGTSCIVPNTSYQVQVFPTRLRIYDLSHSNPKLLTELIFELQGPLEDFTVQNDLERGEVRVWGKTTSGFIRYTLNSCMDQTGLLLNFEKTASEGIKIYQEGNLRIVQPKDSFSLFDSGLIASTELFRPPLIERLSLGNHKAQDWELVHRRLDLSEILPIWHRLGQLIPASASIYQNETEGTLALLQMCREGLSAGCPEKLVRLWINLYRASMHGIMVPRLLDDQFQGIIDSQSTFSSAVSPLVLLTESAKLIRRLFIQTNELNVLLLPALPPEFHCGRVTDARIKDGKITMEWSKKIIRRLEVCMNDDVEVSFHFRHVKQYRLRRNMNEKGCWISSGSSVHLEKNTLYFFDNFK